MPLYTPVPTNDPDLHQQKELSDVPDDQFEKYFEAKKPGLILRIYRFACFILFLGPIRFILTLFFLFIFYVGCSILPSFKQFFKTERAFKDWAQKILYPSIRGGLFCLGILHIKTTGSLKYDTRTIVVNHLTMIDIITVISQFDASFLSMSSLENVHFFKKTRQIFGLIFVNRSKSSGTTAEIQKIQNDPSVQPIVIFPEGKVTNGDALLGFRSGAFVNDTPIQPMTLRYNHWLCPKNMATIAWNEWNTLLYIYQLFSIPFMTLEIDILPQIIYKGNDKSPSERAAEVELLMANSLGCLALHKTNKEYFTKQKDE
ncbi:Acyltransferase family protein [Tritrichomonas foetus]|uniref:Acyltransferase family protein n=1 Tax=Tritrichomonas foetus TaxID=1144522 RepID=A0A1J4JZR9_9EUKA|nr:Acyltransferase family protein [Tritrichomonas foetus]|eukprot:OHT04663.1 Acyltransferase family protein [Tritrichomonas foetus]